MKIYIAADHRGFELKKKLVDLFLKEKLDFADLGAAILDSKDNYTDYAVKVAQKVKENKGAMGILLCGSGVGVDITANKFDGIRASIGKNKEQVKAGRHDDDMNVLVIAADFTKEEEAKEMVEVFLKTKFQKLTRFKKRLEDIKRIEENN